ncbi:MAG: sigma-70 family RNA polymerase sigma factor [Acidobacteriota bacterium]|nr:sigma-70 family RNA polymerase sigma factor [Acidobacteriota bacterium]
MNESDLLTRLQSGDDQAYSWLVRTYSPRMLAVARRLLRHDDLAEEAVQEAFVSAFRGIGRFRAGAQLSTWLHRIVVNAALMMLRQRRRRPETSIDALLPSWHADGHRVLDPAAGTVPADVELQRAETRASVRAAIASLPDTYRVALLLRDIEQLDVADAAEALGITPNALKIRVHRARQALLTLLTTGPDARRVAGGEAGQLRRSAPSPPRKARPIATERRT